MSNIITNLGPGLGVVAYDGKVVITNQDGKALFALSPEGAETFAKAIVDAIGQIRGKGKIFNEGT